MKMNGRNLLKYVLVGIAFLVLVGCTSSCTPQSEASTAIKVYYLFDISGSYRESLDNGKTPLVISVERAIDIADYLSNLQDHASFPQAHQIGYISEQVKHGKPAIKLGQASPFDKVGSAITELKKDLKAVLRKPQSSATDVYGGLYNASQALAGSGALRNVLVVFSDLHVATSNPTNYDIDMRGINVLAYYIETGRAKTNPGILQQDIKRFTQLLESKGCAQPQVKHVGAFDLSHIRDMIAYDTRN